MTCFGAVLMTNCIYSVRHKMDSNLFFLKNNHGFLAKQGIILIFAATIPTTPLNDAYHGGTSFFMTST